MDFGKESLALGFAWYLAFVFSTVLHEAAHAYTSWRLGDSTAYEGGQVSLDPMPHIRREPFGMVLVPLLSFFLLYRQQFMIGWASAPFNPRWAHQHPRRSALMALAGPVANLLLVLVSGGILRLGLELDWFQLPDVGRFTELAAAREGSILSGVAMLLSILFFLNLILFSFNLIPIPPLDGSGIVPLFLGRAAGQRYLEFVWQSNFSLFGIVIAWFVFPRVFGPIADVAVQLLYAGLF